MIKKTTTGSVAFSSAKLLGKKAFPFSSTAEAFFFFFLFHSKGYLIRNHTTRNIWRFKEF